ncbi:MAG: DNRLRE domain-containing protein [Planctomycetaceae bacterium]
MTTRRMFCMVVLLLTALRAEAAVFVVTPTTDRDALDSPGGGSFEFLSAENSASLTAQLFSAGGDEYRGALEFDISGVPAGQTIDSATLSLFARTGRPVGSEPNLQLHGYTGDGTISLADFTQNNLLMEFTSVGDNTTLNADVTSLIQSLYIGGNPFVGFNTRTTTSGGQVVLQAKESSTLTMPSPQLSITYSATAVPEPSGLMACSAAFALIEWLRRRPTANVACRRLLAKARAAIVSMVVGRGVVR